MGVFYHEEPQNHTKRCKYLTTTLKEVFSHCQTSRTQLSSASLGEESTITDLDEEKEVVVSAVRSRAMEKQKNKPSLLREGLYVTKTKITTQEREDGGGEEEEEDDNEREQEFLSVKSCFSCSSNSVMSTDEAFHSVRTNLSRCSSMNNNKYELVADLSEYYWRSSIIQELCCHCEGWPFGLCRKAFLLPPLPKSPSESWLFSKITQRSSKK